MNPLTTRTHLGTRATLLAATVGLSTLALLPGLSSPANAAETACGKWASPSGSDSAAGTSAAPYRSAAKLAGSLATGQVGCLRAGSYSGDVTLQADGSTLRSAPGERATLNLDILRVPFGVDDATVSDLNIVGSGEQLTTRLSGNRFTFTRNDVTNNNRGRDQGGSCVLVADAEQTTTGGRITLNRIHGCGTLGSNFGHGIYTQNVDDLLIEDNLIYKVGSYAVQLYPKASRTTVRHNVVDGGLGSIRGAIVIDGQGNGHRIEQNVLTHAQVGAVQARVGSGHSSVNNCFWQNPSNASGNISVSGDITSDPGFRDRNGSDYRLASGTCLSKVGYDTATKVAQAHTGAPATEPAPAASPAATTAPAPTSSPAPRPAATTAPTNKAPVVTIKAPTAQTWAWRTLRVETNGTDDGRIVKTEVFIDNTRIARVARGSYAGDHTVTNLAYGDHSVTVFMTDDKGLVTKKRVYWVRG